MAKRGPKRKAGPRYKCGKLVLVPKRVGPTEDLIAKRIARFVIAGVKPDKDLNLAESWLSVLYAAEVIDQELHDTGNKYHYLYKTLFPQGFIGSSLDLDMIVDGQPFEPISDDGIDDMALAWRSTERILAAHGNKAHALVKNICVYGRFERFIDISSPRPDAAWQSDAINKTLFVTALDALAIAYGLKGNKSLKQAA